MKTKHKKVETVNIQFGTVNTKHFSMDYFCFGTGKRTLVILPGLNARSSMSAADAIAQTYKILTSDFTIYVFDRKKGILTEPYTVKNMADDTAQAMQKLGLRSADIFGASQGGMMAMEIAINHPDLVNSLILGSSSAHVTGHEFDIFDNWIALAKAGNTEELYLSFAGALYPRDMFEKTKDLWIDISKTVTKEDLERFVVLAEGMRGFDITANLKKIVCPVLVIGSKDDKVFRGGESEQIARFLENSSDCELYMYNGYGHAVFDCTADFQERMFKFLQNYCCEMRSSEGK